MKNGIYILLICTSLLSCSKNKNSALPTIINVTVTNAVTGEPENGIHVKLGEETAGFPFSATSVVDEKTTDSYGKLTFTRSGSKELCVAISGDNEFVSNAYAYTQIINYDCDINLNKTNNINLTIANYGFINLVINGDLGSDSIWVKSDHTTFHSDMTVPFYSYNAGFFQQFEPSDRITGKHYFEKHLFFNGNETIVFDTIEIFKGQTTDYELHF